MVLPKIGPEKPWYLSALLAFLGEDVPGVVGVPPAAFSRDVNYIVSRVTSEGESFLTKTLPAFGKAIDLALQGDQPLLAPSFKKRRRSSALPAFLQALTRRVFSDGGYILEKPCIQSIRLLRQLCFWCKKIEKGFTRESLRKAIVDFIEVDNALPDDLSTVDRRLLGTAQAVIHAILRKLPRISGWLPGHGPGNVAGREGVVGKRQMTHSYTDLESVFRPIPFFFSLRDAAESPQRVTGRFKCKFGLSRTEFVEKDSSGPRTIGLEPSEYMWCQQSLKRALYNHIEKPGNFAFGQINFTDQSINRKLTSEWNRYVTLDMSKASDRNSLALVESLFARDPFILRALKASRTPGTVLPNGQILWYKKFAPMGSAVCFPVEAMVFYALAVAVLNMSGVPLLLARRLVYVYGDDLILPIGFFEKIDRAFRSVGLLLSEGKCCISGKFRESCGMDAFDGVDVTPIRMKKVYPKISKKSRLSVNAPHFVPIVEHSNALMRSGYRFASIAFRKAALRTFPLLGKLKLPITVADDYPVLSWFDPCCNRKISLRWRNSIPYVHGWMPQATKIEGDRSNEGSYFRESLCHGGSVGHIKYVSGELRRHFDLKYGTILKRKRVVYWSRTVEMQ